MSIKSHVHYNELFFCDKKQQEMFDFIRENNSELFANILASVEVKKGERKDRDVMVTLFFSSNPRDCAKTCTPEQFKLIKKFKAPITSTCPTIHSGMLSGWITENVFVVGEA